jgi:ribosomal protein S18 acetylase RimI-like enzyme
MLPIGTWALRAATLDDVARVLAFTRALNAIEQIVIDDHALEQALRRLLADPSLGCVWLIEQHGSAIGHAVVTYGYDLEFGGRDSYLTELWIDPAARNHGAGTAALAMLERELRARDIRALHLGVRPDNPAIRLYERAGFERAPRLLMTRRLG